MVVKETILEGCYIIEPKVFEDDRGCFFETFNQDKFHQLTGLKPDFVQDNQSLSSKGVLRGLHFQIGSYAQAKLVRVVQGKVLDVALDLRENSKTFGKYFSIELDGNNNKQLFVPRGMAHGFLTLEENTIFAYKCDNFYHKASERGIIYNDPTINIDWGVREEELVLSEKDKVFPSFEEFFS